MKDLITNLGLMFIAGILFGLWPLLIKKSHLSPWWSAAIFSMGGVAIIIGVAIFSDRTSLANADWKYAIAGATVGAIGLLCFNGLLTRLSPSDFPLYFVATLVVQTLVPGLAAIYLKGINRITVIGLIASIIAVVCLLWPTKSKAVPF